MLKYWKELSEVTEKISVNFPPVIVKPFAGFWHEERPTLAGCGSVWVSVPEDFTKDDMEKIFSVRKLVIIPYTPKKVGELKVKVPSSKLGKFYNVTIYPDLSKSCTCSGFGFHGSCKHQKMVSDDGTLSGVQEMIQIFEGATSTVASAPTATKTSSSKKNPNFISVF